MKNFLSDLLWTIKAFLIWSLWIPVLLIVTLFMGLLLLICMVLVVTRIDKKAVWRWKQNIRYLIPLHPKTILETTNIQAIMIARGEHLQATGGDVWDGNDSVQYYAECIRYTAPGKLEQSADGKFIVRTYRVYAEHRDFHMLHRVSKWNLKGLRKALEKDGYSVQQLYYRIGEGNFKYYPRNTI